MTDAPAAIAALEALLARNPGAAWIDIREVRALLPALRVALGREREQGKNTWAEQIRHIADEINRTMPTYAVGGRHLLGLEKTADEIELRIKCGTLTERDPRNPPTALRSASGPRDRTATSDVQGTGTLLCCPQCTSPDKQFRYAVAVGTAGIGSCPHPWHPANSTHQPILHPISPAPSAPSEGPTPAAYDYERQADQIESLLNSGQRDYKQFHADVANIFGYGDEEERAATAKRVARATLGRSTVVPVHPRIEAAEQRADTLQHANELLTARCLELEEKQAAIGCGDWYRDKAWVEQKERADTLAAEVEQLNKDWQFDADSLRTALDMHVTFREQILVLEAEIARLRQAQTWQPIATAPKNKRVLVRWTWEQSGGSPSYDVVWQMPDGSWTDDCGASLVVPTHWMPLPAISPVHQEQEHDALSSRMDKQTGADDDPPHPPRL